MWFRVFSRENWLQGIIWELLILNSVFLLFGVTSLNEGRCFLCFRQILYIANKTNCFTSRVKLKVGSLRDFLFFHNWLGIAAVISISVKAFSPDIYAYQTTEMKRISCFLYKHKVQRPELGRNKMQFVFNFFSKDTSLFFSIILSSCE